MRVLRERGDGRELRQIVLVMSAPPSLVFLGAINWDTTVFVKTLPRPGEEVPVIAVEEGPGGKGANAAVAAAKILGGERVALVGALGDDPLEPPLRKSIRSEGVNTEGVVVVRGSGSGRAYVVVDEAGRKEIHTHFGANDSLGAEQVRSPGGADSLASAGVAVIMDVPLAAAVSAAAAMRRHGGRVIYSPGVRGGGDKEGVAEVLSMTDDLVLDRPELQQLTGDRSPAGGARAVCAGRRGLRVVVTLGPSGSLVCEKKRVTRVPGVKLGRLGLRAVNSTGAGDAFIAAYAWRSVLGDSIAAAAKWGNLAGALKASNPETRGSPSRTELEEAMGVLTPVRRPRGSRSSRAA